MKGERIVRWPKRIAGIAALALLAPGAGAGAGDAALLGFGLDRWTTADGLPQNSITSIVQGRDGYLWLGTFGGLVRFDGLRFRVFDLANEAGLGSNRVVDLCETRDGVLWIATEDRGVTRRRDGLFESLRGVPGYPRGTVWNLLEDSSGTLWMAASEGLYALNDDAIHRLGTADGLPHDTCRGLFEGPRSELWVGTLQGVARLREGRVVDTLLEELPGQRRVFEFCEDPDGGIWLAGDEGLLRVRDGGEVESIEGGDFVRHSRALLRDSADRMWLGAEGGPFAFFRDPGSGDWRPLEVPALATLGQPEHRVGVRALCEDREGNLWIGTDGLGLARLVPNRVRGLTERDGLLARSSTVLAGDGQGGLYVGCSCGGLAQQVGERFVEVLDSGGLSFGCVSALHLDREGGLWIGRGEDVLRHDGREQLVYGPDQGLSRGTKHAILQDSAGALWVGGEGGLDRLEGESVVSLGFADGLMGEDVRSLYEDREGLLWVGTADGICAIADGRVVRTFGPSEGLPPGATRCFWEDDRGDLWLGTYGGGLARLRGDQVTRITTQQGLAENAVSCMLEDGRGHLVLNGNRGLSSVPIEQLQGVADGERARVLPLSFGVPLGMETGEGQGGAQSSGWRSPDGRLWFPSIEGLVVLDPAELAPNPVVPAVVVEELRVDGVDYPPGRGIEAPPGERDLEIRYTGISFDTPELVSFRYRLEGYDEHWIEAGTRRVAYYTQVPPGAYRFRVAAANADGIWNQRGAGVDLVLRSSLFETPWFRGLLTLLTVMLAGGLFFAKVKRVQRRALELESTVAQRTAELRRARDELEDRVHRRTVQLAEANETLLRDMEERQRLEEQLLSAQKLESVGRLAGGVAHDFNNVLTVVLGGADLVLSHASHPELVAVDARQIREAAERAAELTRQLLAFARRQHIEPRVCDVNELVQGLEGMLRRLLGETIELQIHTADELWPVLVDPNQFEQVLLNLVVNARDALPGGGRIAVETANRRIEGQRSTRWAELEPGDYVGLVVRDTGTGIEQGHLQHLFEPFYSTKEAGRGTGLGLATCYGIVRQSGGQIRVESEPGLGSTFEVLLPRSEALPDLQPELREVTLMPRGSETVLIVEDEPQVRAIARCVLSESGYRTLEAEHGAAALALLEREGAGVDLVLTDVVMPGMSGVELMDRVQERHPRIKGLFMSGYHESIIAAGAGLVSKPFTAATLARRVREVLDH